MDRDRDVGAFDRRADSYEQGRIGQWHARVSTRIADLLVGDPSWPGSVLDVGCGTGALLRDIAHRDPGTARRVGMDAAPRMAAAAAESAAGLGVSITTARAEAIPFSDGAFDVVVSVLSFDHWGDQGQGLVECARVLAPSGRLVLVDLFSPWLWPTTRIGRRGRARTVGQATRTLRSAGFRDLSWQGVAPLIRVVVARR